MLNPVFRTIFSALAMLACLLCTGCASSRSDARFEGDGGSFAAAFEASRETLRDFGFVMERVDASAGVITTQARTSSGLATPWDRDQSTLSQEADDLLNHHRRRVRITFSPPTESGQKPETADISHIERWVAVVEVAIDQVQYPGLRVPARAGTLWSVTTDPARSDVNLNYQYDTPQVRDVGFERRIAEAIERRRAKLNASL